METVLSRKEFEEIESLPQHARGFNSSLEQEHHEKKGSISLNIVTAISALEGVLL